MLSGGVPLSTCPNGDGVADSMTETLSHEFFEALTDPEVTMASDYGPPLAWYDKGNKAEIADLCEGLSGLTPIGKRTFVVQEVWVSFGFLLTLSGSTT